MESLEMMNISQWAFSDLMTMEKYVSIGIWFSKFQKIRLIQIQCINQYLDLLSFLKEKIQAPLFWWKTGVFI